MIDFIWSDLDKAAKLAANKYKTKTFSGVYGIPRGGLCLAVKLSHLLNIPLLDLPQDGCLIVDDIYDSGKTLEKYKNYKNATYFVLISKKDPTLFDSYITMKNKEWIIFAWEDASKALKDKKEYYAKN
jgi:hypoxanthine phosphoribosyltransferase